MSEDVRGQVSDILKKKQKRTKRNIKKRDASLYAVVSDGGNPPQLSCPF